MLTLFAHIYVFFSFTLPAYDTAARCRGYSATSGRVSKGGFFPPVRGFALAGARIKREYLEENVKIQGRQAATAKRWMGVPLRNSRRYTAVHLFS